MWPIGLKTGPIGCPKTSVRNNHYWLRKNPKEHSSHPHQGGSLKSRTVCNVACSAWVWNLVYQHMRGFWRIRHWVLYLNIRGSKRLEDGDNCIIRSVVNCEGFLFFLWPCDPTRVMASSFTRFLDHTQRRTAVGMTPLDKWSARRRDLYLTTHDTHNKHLCPRWDSNPRSQQASGRRPTP